MSAQDVETFEPETQLLGASPVEFVDAVINAVNDYTVDAAEELLETLLARDAELDPIAMRRAVNVLLNFLQDRIDSVYDRFELFCLANVLRVPPHIKLPTDLPLADLSVSAEREAELKREQDDLLGQIRREMATHTSNERELGDLCARESGAGSAVRLSEDVAAVCKASKVSGPHEFVKMVGGDIEAITKHFETITRNAATISRSAAPHDDPSRAAKRHRADASSSALADVANAFYPRF